jgi:alkaline phosphatase D
MLSTLMAQSAAMAAKKEEKADKKKDKQPKSTEHKWANGKEVKTIQGPDLESSLLLLDMGGEKRQDVLDRYSAIYNALFDERTASFADVAADETVRKLFNDAGLVHLGGPMLGQVATDRVSVWVRTLYPANVEVIVDANGQKKKYGPVKSTFDTDLSAIVPVSGLKPNQTYHYSVLVDGKSIPIPEGAVMRTAPQDKVRINFGTCAHRWGLTNRKQSDTILSREPHAMLMYGDSAVQDRLNFFNMHRADYMLRDFHAAFQNLVASTPIFTAWDDHDYFDNDLAGIPEGFKLADKQGVREVWRTSWNNPGYGFDKKGEGIFHHSTVGPCDIIMLDNRYFRTGKKGEAGFLGEEQKAWLKATLLKCKAPFKVITCGTMWSDYVSNGKDSWGVYDPEGREDIFNFIEQNRISGVLLLSGDRHGARGFIIERPSGYTFYEFEPASLGGRSGPPFGDNPLFAIKDQYAFGEFDIDATKPDPEVTFRLIMEDGSIHYEIKLTQSQLTPRARANGSAS